MKAIVVIDELPKSCCECPLSHSEAGFFGDICDSVCTVLDRTNIVFMDGTGKPDWCPLKPLPQEGTEFDVIDTKTGKYADLQKIALKEEWAKGLVYCDMEGFAIEQDGTLVLLDECGNCAYPPEGRFKLIWNIGEAE